MYRNALQKGPAFIEARICSYVYELKITLNWVVLFDPWPYRVLAWLAAVLDTKTGLTISTWRAHESELLELVAYG
ncbi:hypothetical protein FQR65_LT00938 [Abscondita terminalis]|nr:hypothetical protein FQR65_LT00938 [Abscondita terminalis]